ncbi:MAG: hypothetical protein J1E37_06075 [Prevotella sp.]|nr:hypothetical protein [Prevotella sp.]
MGVVIEDKTLIILEDHLRRVVLSNNSEIQQRIREIIRSELFEVRRQLITRVPIINDPRGAARGIRTSVYKKILGGNVNILQSKKTHGGSSYEPPKKLVPGQRGGNRRKRSQRTQQIMSYGPLDRQFILRFVNGGTRNRVIGFRNTTSANRQQYFSAVRNRTGFRGRITAKDWFKSAAQGELGDAADRIAQIIEQELALLINEGEA